MTQSEAWGQEKKTEHQYREVWRETDTPKGREGSEPETEGGGPGWQRRHRWIGWHPEKQSPKTDIKMAMKQEVWMGKTREDR